VTSVEFFDWRTRNELSKQSRERSKKGVGIRTLGKVKKRTEGNVNKRLSNGTYLRRQKEGNSPGGGENT